LRLVWTRQPRRRRFGSLAACREGVERTRALDEPFVHAVLFESFIRWVRREPDAQGRCADEAVALGQAHGFPMWVGAGKACRGAARVLSGDRTAVSEVIESRRRPATTVESRHS
jgi:hypothetical protein